jgi:aryl sulfotransferase
MQPQLLHTYQSYIQDSTRWAQFNPRADDIVISTPVKSGTTWTQEIVTQLVFVGQEIPYSQDISPWLDNRMQPLDEVLSRLEAQRHRRVIKTHLPLDGLPFYPQVKYVVVGRDPRDVFMSWWNHYASFTPEHIAYINNYPGRIGPPLPPVPEDIHEFWQLWIREGGVEWQLEEYRPYFGVLRHFQDWWNFRDLPNILLVHYADLLADAPGQIRRIANFLDITATGEQIAQIAEQTTLSAMRSRAQEKDTRMARMWVNGAQSFFYKGTNGRWKDVLTAEELAMYEDAATQILAPECKVWLERGTLASGT